MVRRNRIGCVGHSVATMFSRRRSALVPALGCFASLLLSVTQLSANVILPSLPAGTQYELAFVTSGTRDATSGSFGDYNTFVTQQAALSSSLPTGVAWHAIVSTSGHSATVASLPINAVDNAPSTPSIPVYNTHGELVANASTPLYSGSLLHAIDYNQSGGINGNIYVWTGSNSTGTARTDLSTPGALGFSYVYPYITYPAYGYAFYQDGQYWLDARSNGTPSTTQFSFYALSSPLTATPEPSTVALLATGAATLMFVAWRRRKRSQ